jgi:hypothetical protein
MNRIVRPVLGRDDNRHKKTPGLASGGFAFFVMTTLEAMYPTDPKTLISRAFERKTARRALHAYS